MQKIRLVPILFALLAIARAGDAPTKLAFKDYVLGSSLLAMAERYDLKDCYTIGTVLNDQSETTLNEQPKDLRSGGIIEVDNPTSGGKLQTYPESIAQIPATVECDFYGNSIQDWDIVANPMVEKEQRLRGIYKNAHEATVPTNSMRPWTEMEKKVAQTFLLGRIEVGFDSGSFDVVAAALEAKYGPPTKRESRVFDRAHGQHSRVDYITWKFDGDTIEAQHYRDYSTSCVLYTRDAITQREEINRAHQAQAASKDL